MIDPYIHSAEIMVAGRNKSLYNAGKGDDSTGANWALT